MLEVPDVLRNKALILGASKWLHELPALLADLEAEWSIEVGRPYQGATEAYVAEATRQDGTKAVLKLVIPGLGDAARNEIAVLRLTAGEGCVRLFEADLNRGALLLERLGRPLYDLDLPIEERLPILCSTAARVWRPAPGCGLPTGADKGRWLGDFITSSWEELARPCSEQVITHALHCAARRISAHDDERAVVVHGDVHQWNALEAIEGFKLVDPDGLLAEAEYDMGILMREDPLDLLTGSTADRTHERAARLATLTGLNATAIAEWGVVERVATGLLCTRIDLQPVGRQMLAVASRLAGSVF